MEILLFILACIGLAIALYSGSDKAVPLLRLKSPVLVFSGRAIIVVLHITVFILLIKKHGISLIGILYAALLIGLSAIAIRDARDKEIGKNALLLLLLGGIAAIALDQRINVVNGAVAMLSVFSILWITRCFSKGGLGLGDVLLCSVLALYLGTDKVFNMLVFSAMMCGATGLMLVAVDRSFSKESLPFAPFVAVSTAAVLFI